MPQALSVSYPRAAARNPGLYDTRPAVREHRNQDPTVPVDVFEADLPIFDAAAGLGVPIYIHSGPQLQQLRDIAYSGFDRWTSMILGTGGWRWHAEAGLATLTR